MKYIIIFIALIAYGSSNDKIEKLENIYINKAEQLKDIRDKVVLEADTKLKNDSRRLAETYIRALKKEQISIVKTGDLEAALKIKAKILEIENVLKGGQLIKPKVNNVDPKLPVRDKVNHSSKHFYTNKEQLINTTWTCYDGDGKKTGVEVTLLAGGKFNVTNSPGWRSYWRWGLTNGCIIYGVSQVNGCRVTFAKNGGSTTSFYNISRKESYKGQWVLKK